MKKITLSLFLLLTGAVCTAQDIIVDQPVDTGATGLISFEGNNDVGVYCADDFELTETTMLGSLDVYGFTGSNANPTSDFTALTGISVYIYEDDNGLPAGDPSQDGTGVIELSNIPSSSFELVEADDSRLADFININLTEANGGTPLSLDAGVYWLAVFPNVDETFDTAGANRWNWLASSAANTGTEPVLIDPDDVFAGGFTSWSNISTLIDASFPSFAFTLRDDQELSVTDNVLADNISVYPNPTNGDLNISSSRSFGRLNISVINVAGQQVLSTTIEGVNGTLNSTKLPSGIYFAEISSNQGSTVIKFIKN
ncbi:T9SS C-terminal target domain-containing protein [Dokdonia sinensis]|uniref:T9SS C-terminal target domain-containing protein n=1 Tax=Dokdonia sinensis TaxID=2479847 RepID=A0A3M0G4R9_9FLAO|nr:T9SS type A sorting domain-containing protein [Dokdonia sinensis]RMB56159.1 T9SS C-terminal target domain-containing protein [Dokdonia sinensis]